MIDIEIDKLTNSIEDAQTREAISTIIKPFLSENFKSIDWEFDWLQEYNKPIKKVSQLNTFNNDIIQGLISLEDKKDHVFMHLIENAKHNKGKKRQYLGVAGNLVAFACKCSFECGYDGFISFISKTALKQHYQETLGAKVLFGDTMVIETTEAMLLVEKYFKTI